MKIFLNGLFKDNAIFSLILGLCSALAVTTTLEKSFMMGLCILFVLVISNLIICLIKKIIPDNVKTPVYIIIIGTLVTVIGAVLEKYTPALFQSLGIYLSLITVNCLILGRAITVASKKSVKHTLLDSLGIGTGFILSLILIGFIRELIGNNSITLVNDLSEFLGFKLIFKNILPISSIFPLNIFITPAGAFLTIGLLLGIFNFLRRKHESN